MTRERRQPSAIAWLRCALLATLAVLMTAPAASAAPISWAFSDSTPVQPSLVQGDVTVLRDTDCLLPAARARTVGLSTALANAQKMLVRSDGSRALRRYTVSPDARTYARAMQAAVEAMLKARPDAALAALLRAHTLAPRDPRPLIDASVLLVHDGLPNEALALLHAAARMHMPPRSPYGINRQAELANDQGYALIALHRWSAARAALNTAYAKAPTLTEAEHNLAVVAACTGHPAQAQQLLAAAARRDHFAAAQVVVDKTTGTSQPEASALFDLAQGQTPKLPQLTVPIDAPHGWAEVPEFTALGNQESSAAMADATSVGQLTAKLESTPMLPVTRKRINDIIGLLGGARDPNIKPLSDASVSAADADAYGLSVYAQSQCADRNAWTSAQSAYDVAENHYLTAVYQYDTGLASNLANPVAHQLALTVARQHVEGAVAAEAGFIAEGGYTDGVCVHGHGAPPNQDITGSVSTPLTPGCPPILQGKDFSLNLSVVSFTINCDEVSIGASTPGWIGAFGTVSHSFTNGSTTIYAGPQVGATIQAGPFGGGAQAQAGGYITISGDGTIADVGLRGSVSAGVSAGATSVYTGTSLDFSFTGQA